MDALPSDYPLPQSAGALSGDGSRQTSHSSCRPADRICDDFLQSPSIARNPVTVWAVLYECSNWWRSLEQCSAFSDLFHWKHKNRDYLFWIAFNSLHEEILIFCFWRHFASFSLSECVLQSSSKPAAWSSTPSSSSRASTWGSTTSSTGATAWPGAGPSFPLVGGSCTASTPRTTRSITSSHPSRGSCSPTLGEGFQGWGWGLRGILP